MLAAAQAALVETTEQLKGLTAKRHNALLTGASDRDVALIDSEIATAQHVQRTRSDRVQVLLEEAERKEAERRVKEKLAHIERVEKKLAERDAVAAELAAAIAVADRCWVKLRTLNLAIQAGWPWPHGSIGAALLDDGSALLAIANEIYRVGGRPPVTGGVVDLKQVPTYPGAKCADLSYIMLPERSAPPLIERFAQASAAASRILRSGRNDPIAAPAVPPAAQPEPAQASAPVAESAPAPAPAPANGAPPMRARTDAEREMARLLKRQSELVDRPGGMTEADDSEYELISKEITELSRGMTP
jgi:hypothetical protein